MDRNFTSTFYKVDYEFFIRSKYFVLASPSNQKKKIITIFVINNCVLYVLGFNFLDLRQQ